MRRLIPITLSVAAVAIVVIVVVALSGGGSSSEEAASTTTSQPAATTAPPETTPPAPDEPAADPPSPTTTDPEFFEGPAVLYENLALVTFVWETNWDRRTIDTDELLIGLFVPDPRDRIRPIDDPAFETVAEADAWLQPREPGASVTIDGEARFYPLRIMTSHEIVNDEFGEVPVAVTYCPLCNTMAVFDRRVDGDVLRFGVSGLLRMSDLVMWDDATTSLWQQITGEGIVGDLAGTQLEFVPSALVRWDDFRSTNPDGVVLSIDQGFGINYGRNPYEGYTSRPVPYGFFQDEPDPRFPALERVVGVRVNGMTKAYPFSVIEVERVVNDVVDGIPVVVFWGASDTADALDASQVADGRGVGTGIAFSPVVDGRVLTFTAIDDTTFRDEETGSTWTLLGVAIDGPLAGKQLGIVVHQNELWFAWASFNPDAPVHGA